MASCPGCGSEVEPGAAYCSRCGRRLGTVDVEGPYGRSASTKGSRAALMGFAFAFLSLLIVPEIFGSAAVVLGAYVWKEERGRRGLWLVIVGLLCLIVGIYLTSYFELGDLLP